MKTVYAYTIFAVMFCIACQSRSPRPAETAAMTTSPATQPDHPLPLKKMEKPKALNLTVLKKINDDAHPTYNEPLIAKAFTAGEVYRIPVKCKLRRGLPIMQMKTSRTFALTCTDKMLPFFTTYNAPPHVRSGATTAAITSPVLYKELDSGDLSGLIEIDAISGTTVYFRFVKLD